ncbi:MAG TPA: alpha/beta fold hydrolase [Micropepsaceae bacterium]|nr:alpha/beta fold hydrolase [Micropepsaceae bacterium]
MTDFRASAKALIVASLFAGLPAIGSAANAPAVKGTISLNAGRIGGHDRQYAVYVPPNLMPGAPLVIVLHGGGGDGPYMRMSTGYEFDMLADANGFVVVYPNGIDRGWNTCRKGFNNTAKRQKIDDVAFIEAIIAHEVVTHGIDRRRVFATGHSFGGQMAFRLALERPNEFAGIAAISSNLPVPADNECAATGMPIPAMIINGTEDPVNPYRGGRTGGGNGGSILSTDATMAYFVRLNGAGDMPQVTRLPHQQDSDPTWVERAVWTNSGRDVVVLYTIHSGGHVVPQPWFRYPSNVGRQTMDLDAPAVIWTFFAALPPR